MKIEAITDNSFYILLTDVDMRQLGITFEELDYSNIETRRVIWTLLEQARCALGRDIDPREKMLIEVSRVKNGCRIEFTTGKKGQTRYKVKRESDCVCAFFNSFAALCVFLDKQRNAVLLSEKAELYSYKDGYALILAHPLNSQGLKLLVSEYAVCLPVREIALNEVREHGRLIFEGKPRSLSI